MDSQQEQEYFRLMEKGKAYANVQKSPGQIRKGLEYYKRAFRIQKSEKLERRISKLQSYLELLNKDEGEDSDSEGEEMVHLGEGFYLFRGLYDKLYDHQRQGVLFLWKLWRMKKGGILGDDMGLGKTIQVCAFLGGMFDAERIKSVLVVVPVGVIINWTKEFEQWVPGLDVYTCHDQGKREREGNVKRVQTKGGVCVTTYGLVTTITDVLSTCKGKQFTWDYVILDEGHKIKNPTTKSAQALHQIHAKHRIVLSGTPIMNNLKELWSLYDWAHSGQLLGSAKTFAMEYESHITRAREKDATAGEQRLGVEMSKGLQSLIKPFFLRRTKAEVFVKEGQNTGNAPHMPTLTRKNDLICWVFLSEIQKEIYRDFLLTDEVRALLSSTTSPLTALTVLKKICDHPRLMSNRQCRQLGLLMTDEGVDLDRLDEMVGEDSAHYNVDHIEDEVLIKESGKMVFVIKLLDNLKAEGHRCLFFSQSRKILNIIQKIVKNRGHRFVRIDGTIRGTDERQKIIDTFMTDSSYTLFLLTTQVGGVGLTLTAADRVIIYDPSWNPATDSQAVDRAFRIGQDRNVVVYRLITCGSIEEKIYRRQIFKDGINKMTTGDQKNPYRYFTKQELHELFELSDTTVSVTQEQIEKLQRGKRKTDTGLDAHIAFLYSLEIFGISDHDLMFEIQAHSEVEGEADINDDASEEFVKSRALKALDALKTESETNREISEKLGKYPGPQSEELGKLFKTFGPTVPSEAQKRNFPKPMPQFSSADLIKESDVSAASTLSPERIDNSDVKAEGFEVRMKTLSLDKEPSDDEILEPRTPSPPPPRSEAKRIKGSPLASPYRVLEEALVFSPISHKPIIATEVKECSPDELCLAEHLDSSSVEMKPRISRKRRSSVFRSSPLLVISDSDDESPLMNPTKRRAVIIDSDGDDDDGGGDATIDYKARQSPDEDLTSETNASPGEAAAKNENSSDESSATKPTKHRAVTDDDDEDDDDATCEAKESPAEDLTSETNASPTETAADEEQEMEDEVECTDEETDDESEDEECDVEQFEAVIKAGQEALKRKDLESALRLHIDAHTICGGNEYLKQQIRQIQMAIDKNKIQ